MYEELRMKCPIDAADLVMSDRQGIEIDYCPKCRGVWLDRGELDKIIERSSSEPEMRQPPQDYGRDRQQDYRPDHDRGYQDQKRYKKKSLLGEIFDF
jgi:Zn-finger nucleic acid-binding protein